MRKKIDLVLKVNFQENYILRVAGYQGGLGGDSFSYHDGKYFSTKDRDVDQVADIHCARRFKGAWW